MKISRRPLAATVPSMAMGDIAFNLLIFFVILAKATDDSHLQWEPADSTEVIRAGAAKASIVIDAESKYYLNGQQVGIAQLGPQIEQILEGSVGDDRRVLLKVHRSATANHFEPIIEAVSEAGGTIMHVLEERRNRP